MIVTLISPSPLPPDGVILNQFVAVIGVMAACQVKLGAATWSVCAVGNGALTTWVNVRFGGASWSMVGGWVEVTRTAPLNWLELPTRLLWAGSFNVLAAMTRTSGPGKMPVNVKCPDASAITEGCRVTVT